MTQKIDHYNAHKPYLEAVARTLTEAGLVVEDYWADPNDPRDGAIAIATSEDEKPLMLVWQEETGWVRGREDDHGELKNLYESGLDLLASPQSVVIWVRAVLAGTDNGPILLGMGGRFRDADDEDTTFETELHQYWP